MHPIWLAVLFTLAANPIAAAVFHFPAGNPYKPLLLLNGACILYFLAARPRPLGAHPQPNPDRLGPRFLLLLSLAVIAAYLPALTVNLTYHDWTHRHVAASLDSWSAIRHLFTARQPDGMYRPLAFLSFWLDFHLFGSALWAYHLQSIGLHLVDSILAGCLAIRLGFGARIGRLTALLFGLSAIHFEAVLWPAARFDLLAALFAAISLLLFLAHWDSAGAKSFFCGLLSLLSYAVAVLNKESAYSVALLIPALVYLYPAWTHKAAPRRKTIPFLIALFLLTAALIALRFAIFGGIGGYHRASASFKAVYALVVNSLSLSVFGINATVVSLASICILVAWSCLVVLWVLLYRGAPNRVKIALAFLALLSAIPALSVIGWIQPSLLHTRHLYWPSVWIAIFLACVFDQTRRRRVVAAAFVIVQIAALNYNIWVYRDMLHRLDLSVDLVEYSGSHDAPIAGVPDDPNGVICFIPELKERLEQRIPGASFRFCATLAACGASGGTGPAFQWDAGSRMLAAIPPR